MEGMAEKENVSIKLDKIFLVLSVIGAVVVFVLLPGAYTAPLVFTLLLLVWGSYYAVFSRKNTSEMCCMMSGMAFGMLSGFFVGAIAGLATGDFFISMVIGAVAGVLFGIPVGHAGGPLGRMEGVMAGPMGGMMGGMTGIMMQFYNIQLFVPFLVIIVTLSTWEMIRVIKAETKHISKTFIYIGALLSILAIASTFMNTYTPGAGSVIFGTKQQQFAPAQPAVAPSGGVQQVSIRATQLSYEPNQLTLKKNVPVKLTLTADQNAGCTRSFVFPEFGIKKTVTAGGTATVEFTPTKTGTFPFNCIMGMARGTAVVQ